MTLIPARLRRDISLLWLTKKWFYDKISKNKD